MQVNNTQTTQGLTRAEREREAPQGQARPDGEHHRRASTFGEQKHSRGLTGEKAVGEGSRLRCAAPPRCHRAPSPLPVLRHERCTVSDVEGS